MIDSARSESAGLELPDFSDVQAAAVALRGIAHRTPVMTSTTVDALTGATVFFKCENLQRIGAFKFRGAYNAIRKLSPQTRRAGVMAFSSGNHAQAVALAGRLLDVPTTILMPEDAPALKLTATRGYGATVITYDRYREDREALASRLASERGLALIPPFNHPDVIAGQGTAALELLEETGPLDLLLVPLGGGGLTSGVALAARALAPDCQVIGVEPAAGNDVQQSLARGEIVTIATPRTIADGAQTPAPGPLTFALMRQLVHQVVVADDLQLRRAMALLAARMKLVVEPTGCLGAAAALEGIVPVRGRRVGVILSGGNVDLARFAELVTGL